MQKVTLGKTACVVFLLCATTAIALPAQTLITLHSFDYADGNYPYAGLVQATNGKLYGTTVEGGQNGLGTVFKVSTTGTLTTLYNFCAQRGCTDGNYPYAGLVQGMDGNLYGTTVEGGENGLGTVFRITPTGTLTTLYSFCSIPGCTDGAQPWAGLVQASDGSFYGTTYGGGTQSFGTLFKIAPSSTLTTLYSFCSQSGCTDGASPLAGLLQATDGTLYGTTTGGGTNGGGTVFKVTTSETVAVVYNFCSQIYCTDGSNPMTTVLQATDGNFYGTTHQGGTYGYGTVFEITPSGALTTLHTFEFTDGALPSAGLVQATDGNLYGTTWGGGDPYHGSGTLFRISPHGTLTTLYSFCSQGDCTEGGNPRAGLVQDTDGNFYGTAVFGAYGAGTVFGLSVGLGPFVETQPTFGRVGRAVKILGTNLTGATSVTFNGTPAVFKVISRSLIEASVPVGATSGKVQVGLQNVTLSSNVPFRVKQ